MYSGNDWNEEAGDQEESMKPMSAIEYREVGMTAVVTGALLDRLLEEHDEARRVARDRDMLRGQLREARRESLEAREKLKTLQYQGRFTAEERTELEHSNTWNYALRELRLAGFYEDDVMYGDMLPEAIMELVGVFALQNHSRMSAGIATHILSELLQFKPLSDLTTSAEEWQEVDEGMYQSRRQPSMFATDPRDKETWYNVDEPKGEPEEDDAPVEEGDENYRGSRPCTVCGKQVPRLEEYQDPREGVLRRGHRACLEDEG